MEDAKTNALEAVLLFFHAGHWTEGQKTEWWNRTQCSEATTRNLCDCVRLALGRLPSCFGDFAGRFPSDLPKDMRFSHEQRNALVSLGVENPLN